MKWRLPALCYLRYSVSERSCHCCSVLMCFPGKADRKHNERLQIRFLIPVQRPVPVLHILQPLYQSRPAFSLSSSALFSVRSGKHCPGTDKCHCSGCHRTGRFPGTIVLVTAILVLILAALLSVGIKAVVVAAVVIYVVIGAVTIIVIGVLVVIHNTHLSFCNRCSISLSQDTVYW